MVLNIATTRVPPERRVDSVGQQDGYGAFTAALAAVGVGKKKGSAAPALPYRGPDTRASTIESIFCRTSRSPIPSWESFRWVRDHCTPTFRPPARTSMAMVSPRGPEKSERPLFQEKSVVVISTRRVRACVMISCSICSSPHMTWRIESSTSTEANRASCRRLEMLIPHNGANASTMRSISPRTSNHSIRPQGSCRHALGQ